LSYVLSQETAPLSRELWLYHPLSILLKAYAAIILLTLLTSTEKFHRLLKGLRTLKFPPVLGIMSALMYRYIFILNDERLRTNRARVCRLAGKPRTSSFRIYGNQAALIFLRGKKRAQDIYNAMLARGFTGEFPEYDAFRLHTADWIFLGVVVISFTGVRFGL
jgi:cobalt/nickel transport system permease protein